MPQVTPPAAQVTPQPGTYAPQPSAYPPPGAAPQPQPGTFSTPPKKGLPTIAVIGIVAGGLLVLGIIIAIVAAVAIPAYLTSRNAAVTEVVPDNPIEPVEEPATAELPADVYSQALEAATARMPEGYIIELTEETDVRKVYWAGPPNSEWDSVIIVDKVDGGWKVTDAFAFNESMDGGTDEAVDSGASDAEALVSRFLTAIKNDKPKDAQRLTISPFREDPASAQFSNGEFKRFSIDKVEGRNDGSFWVHTTEVWSYGTDRWRYDVVPTEAGLRIRGLEPATP
jgi:hypothetical protein